jgi:hypothetical protein
MPQRPLKIVETGYNLMFLIVFIVLLNLYMLYSSYICTYIAIYPCSMHIFSYISIWLVVAIYRVKIFVFDCFDLLSRGFTRGVWALHVPLSVFLHPFSCFFMLFFIFLAGQPLQAAQKTLAITLDH